MDKKKSNLIRCSWAGSDLDYIKYHDNEWGVPVYDDRKLFEFLILEGAQAGLSWITILKRRANYKQAFANFSPQHIVTFKQKKIQELLQNKGIIRNKLKIESVIINARAYLQIIEQKLSFSDYIWQFVDGKPIKNKWQTHQQIPTSTKQSDQMAKDLKHHGFKFVGSTICYAYMQAVGMVNDHVVNCFRYNQV